MERPPAVRTLIGRWVAALGSLAGVLLLLAAAVAAPAQAAPGDLDLTFSGDGKQRTDFSFGAGNAAATVRQPDGKIVAVGRVSAGDTGDFALARYNSNGSLDTSFSGDGRQTTNLGSFDGANGVALQSDGRIVAVGGDGNDFALARYNPNGSLDTTFSGDGKQTTDFGAFFEGATGVALQSDGRIVVVGQGGGDDFALARYNPNGSLDTTFSGDGKQTTDFGGFDGANGVALQANGRIVAVGRGGVGFALARYNPNGSLDTTFSGDGKQTTDFGDPDQATGVALQSDGKIVAVGFTGGVESDFSLARYNSNGTLDTSFSGDGKQTTDFGSYDHARGVALQADGKIVAVGDDGDDFALARYNSNGSLDTSFSGDGRQTTDFGVAPAGAYAVALQGDKTIAVGFSDGDFALARYSSNGSLDTTFSGDGRQTTGFAGFDAATGVAIQSDGKIVAVGGAGSTNESGADDFALARYNSNGSLDTTFSGDGRQTTDFGESDGPTGVALQSDGKIVAVGQTGACQCSTSHHDDFALARYNTNGSLDTSFSGDGKQTTDFGSDFDGASAVELQGDGKIVAVGFSFSGTDYDFALARYNPNGSLDTTFSGDGKQTTDFGGLDQATGVALQGDGKIVVTGAAGGNFGLARYNANGSLDTTFSGNGRQTTDFGATDGARGVALQGDGKIVAVGGGGAGNNFALARYNTNGSLDTSFSGDGRQTTDFAGFDRATGVALQGDGKIVAAGGGGTGGDFALARYNPNGLLDTSFSGDGRQTSNFGGGADQANSVALQANGRMVAAGIGLGTDLTSDFALARYLGG